MNDPIMNNGELSYALSKHVPDMQSGFSITTGYGSMTIPAGNAACKFAEFTRQMLAGESDDYLDRLEGWAVMAAQELQDIADEAQEAAGDPGGEGEQMCIRMLLLELDEILQPKWQQAICDSDQTPLAGLEP